LGLDGGLPRNSSSSIPGLGMLILSQQQLALLLASSMRGARFKKRLINLALTFGKEVTKL